MDKNNVLYTSTTIKTPEKTDENSFGSLLAAFASDTSFGGVSKIASNRGILRRLLWAILSATCYGFTIYMTGIMVSKYLQRPVTTSVDVVYENNIKFPALTICNLNKFRKSKVSLVKSLDDLMKEFQNRNESVHSWLEEKIDRYKKAFLKEASLNSDVHNERNEEDDDDDVDEQIIFQQLVSINISKKREELLSRVGHQRSDMVLACSWMGIDCKGGYFSKYWTTFWNWKYGNCFTFNAGWDRSGQDIRALRTSMPGPNFGLSLDINIQQSEYIDELTDEAGLKVVVHDALQLAFPYDEGITIPPGFSTSVALRKNSIQRVDPFNNGSCNPSDEMSADNIYKQQNASRKYSVKSCMKSCLSREQFKQCKCTAVQFGHKFNVCETIKEFNCMYGVHEEYKEDKIGCRTLCPQPCLDETFSYTLMMSVLTAKKKEDAKEGIGENKTDDDVANDFLRLRVYYEQLNLETIVKSTFYDIETLLGDIGGQLGLWVGISVISVAEFGELLVALVMVLFRKYHTRNNVKAMNLQMK